MEMPEHTWFLHSAHPEVARLRGSSRLQGADGGRPWRCASIVPYP